MNKKQILITLSSILLPLLIVSVIVSASSTIGDNVSVGGTLAVASTSTFNGGVVLGNAATDKVSVIGNLDTALIMAATTTTYGLDLNAATLTTDIRLSNGGTIHNTSADVLTIAEATVAITGNETVSGTLTVTGTTTLNEGAVFGNAAADKLSFIGNLDTGMVWAATSTDYLLDMNNATTTAGDIRLSGGAIIMSGGSPGGTGVVPNGSIFVSTSTGFGIYVNIDTTWYQLATTAITASE